MNIVTLFMLKKQKKDQIPHVRKGLEKYLNIKLKKQVFAEEVLSTLGSHVVFPDITFRFSASVLLCFCSFYMCVYIYIHTHTIHISMNRLIFI